VSYRHVPNADSVGAGDACAAAILVGTVLRFDVDRIAALANHAGGYVASQAGATPPLPQSILDMVK
jgi:sugar/nucleoside kinase (ribokinase family)